jgi:hypothetical protein
LQQEGRTEALKHHPHEEALLVLIALFVLHGRTGKSSQPPQQKNTCGSLRVKNKRTRPAVWHLHFCACIIYLRQFRIRQLPHATCASSLA